MEKLCVNCMHYHRATYRGQSFRTERVCTRSSNRNSLDYDPVTGYLLAARFQEPKLEREVGVCGPEGKLFQPKIPGF